MHKLTDEQAKRYMETTEKLAAADSSYEVATRIHTTACRAHRRELNDLFRELGEQHGLEISDRRFVIKTDNGDGFIIEPYETN